MQRPQGKSVPGVFEEEHGAPVVGDKHGKPWGHISGGLWVPEKTLALTGSETEARRA